MSDDNENLENGSNLNENNEGDINTPSDENNSNNGQGNQNNNESSLNVVVPVRNLKSLFNNLKVVLVQDNDLLTFCNTNFSAPPSIRIGIDLEDMPEGPEGAMICIVPGARSRSRGDAYHSHSISILGVIKCTSKTEDSGTDIDALTLDAIGLVDDFINLVEKIVFKKMEEWGIAVTPVDGDSDEIIYPYARAELAYRVEIRSLI